MWLCVMQTMSLVSAKCGQRPMSKQTFSSGIWQTVSSPATEYPTTWTAPSGSLANFWTRKDLGYDLSAMAGEITGQRSFHQTIEHAVLVLDPRRDALGAR